MTDPSSTSPAAEARSSLAGRLSRFLTQSEYARHVTLLMSGTVIGQAIPVLAAPLLTRLYSPTEFGMFALFLSLSRFLAIVGSGRYENAILLPREERDAYAVCALAMSLVASLSVVILLVTLLAGQAIGSLLGQPELVRWLPLLSVSVLVTGVYQTLNYWYNRRREYHQMAINRIAQAGCTVLFSLAFGVAGFKSGGLVMGMLVGQLVATTPLVWGLWRTRAQREDTTFDRMRAMASRYRGFVTFSLPGDALNALTQQVPLVLLSHFFGATTVGQFSLTQRVLGVPASVVGTAFGDVFRERASAERIANGHFAHSWRKTFRYLVLLSIPPFVLLFLLSPWFFPAVFGSQWAPAGNYARLLIPFFFLSIVSSSLGRALYVAEWLRADLLWQVGLATLTTTAVWLAARTGSASLAIGAYSAAYSVMYLIYFKMSYHASHEGAPRVSSG